MSSKAPLTDADFEKADEPSSHGFLGKEASDIEEHFHNLQVYLKGEGGFGKERMLGHFAVMQVAHEWRLFLLDGQQLHGFMGHARGQEGCS